MYNGRFISHRPLIVSDKTSGCSGFRKEGFGRESAVRVSLSETVDCKARNTAATLKKCVDYLAVPEIRVNTHTHTHTLATRVNIQIIS